MSSFQCPFIIPLKKEKYLYEVKTAKFTKNILMSSVLFPNANTINHSPLEK